MSDTKSKSETDLDASKLEPLLEQYYGEFYIPVNWEEGKKSKNYFAHIEKGTKFIFKRKFLRSHKIDDLNVYKKKSFPEGDIIEQRCTFVRGSKEEITFGGFFVIHHIDGNIYGEELSQKQALEYFDLKKMLPDQKEEQKRSARVEIATSIRKYIQKYGEETVSDVLVDILNDYFPEA